MRILVVEDDLILADGITHALRAAGHAVDGVASGPDADAALAGTEYELVILDIELPKFNGFEVLRRLRRRKDATPVLVLTARDAVHDRIHGLDLGADDYMTKPFELGELEARIRALGRRVRGAADDRIGIGRLMVDVKGRRAFVDSAAVDLSAREFALLEALAVRAGRVVSKESLIASLYAWDTDVSANAIEIYVHRVRKKLHDCGVAIRTIRGLGYLLERNGAGG